jgi:hypothetical protein
MYSINSLNIMKILLEDFSVKVGGEDIFKPTVGNESLHKVSNDSGVRVGNFATSKNMIVKHTVFPFINLLGHLLLERLTIKFTIF